MRQSTGTQVASGSASNPGCATTGCSTTWKPPSDFYLAAYNRIKRSGGDDDAVGYSRARVYIGELAHLSRSVRVSPISPARRSLSALRFLRDVVEPQPESQPLIRTQGVAWHPYQHTGQPDRRGSNGVVGIGRANEIQDLLDKFTRRSGENEAGPQTEAARASFFRGALDRARRERVRFVVLYTATDVEPQREDVEEQEPPPFPNGESFDIDGVSHIREYGLFSRRGEVTGTRPYGKDPTGRNFRSLKFPQERRAYCAIHAWAFDNGLDPFTSAGGCPE